MKLFFLQFMVVVMMTMGKPNTTKITNTTTQMKKLTTFPSTNLNPRAPLPQQPLLLLQPLPPPQPLLLQQLQLTNRLHCLHQVDTILCTRSPHLRWPARPILTDTIMVSCGQLMKQGSVCHLDGKTITHPPPFSSPFLRSECPMWFIQRKYHKQVCICYHTMLSHRNVVTVTILWFIIYLRFNIDKSSPY